MHRIFAFFLLVQAIWACEHFGNCNLCISGSCNYIFTKDGENYCSQNSPYSTNIVGIAKTQRQCDTFTRVYARTTPAPLLLSEATATTTTTTPRPPQKRVHVTSERPTATTIKPFFLEPGLINFTERSVSASPDHSADQPNVCHLHFSKEFSFHRVGRSYSCKNATTNVHLERFLRVQCTLSRQTQRVNSSKLSLSDQSFLNLNPALNFNETCKILRWKRRNCHVIVPEKKINFNGNEWIQNSILFEHAKCGKKSERRLLLSLCRYASLFKYVNPTDLSSFEFYYANMNPALAFKKVCDEIQKC